LTTYPHRSATSTEVSELFIALREGTHSCTQHTIDIVLSFSHLSSTYFMFAIKLSFVSLPKSYREATLDSGWKVMTTLRANEIWELTFLPSE